MSAYVYVRSEPGLWTVGYYDAAGKWQSESDHDSSEAAAERVGLLNGGPDLTPALVRSIALVKDRDHYKARCERMREAIASAITRLDDWQFPNSQPIAEDIADDLRAALKDSP